MTMPSLLPNDFCIVRNEKYPMGVGADTIDHDREGFSKRPYWIARVVKLGEDGKFRLNWFAEKPGTAGKFLKTNSYFRESPEAIIPFKNGLVSGEERDMYEAKSSDDIKRLIEEKELSGKTLIVSHGPKQEDIEKAFLAFDSLAQEINDDASTEKDPEAISDDDLDEHESSTAKRKYRINTQSPPLLKKRRQEGLTKEELLNNFATHHWSKEVPQVGARHQVSPEVLESIQEYSDKDLSQIRSEVGRQKVIPKHVSLEGGKYISILNEQKLSAEWTKGEKDAFEEALFKFSEHFDKVSKYIAEKVNNGVELKSTSDCVQYFYDVFKISRAYKSWEKQEIARLEREERVKREQEKLAIKEKRKMRKRKLQSMGIDPKFHSYKGGNITKSEKLCNAIVKIRELVKKSGMFPDDYFDVAKQTPFQTLADESNKVSVKPVSPNTISSLKGISELSNVVESKILQKKPRDARTDNQLKNIQGLISSNASEIGKDNLTSALGEASKQEGMPGVLRESIAQQIGSNVVDQSQIAYLSQFLNSQQQQQRLSAHSDQLKMVLNNFHKQQQGQSENSGSSLSNNPAFNGGNSMASQAAAASQNAHLKKIQNLQNLAQAQAQAQAQQQAQLNLLAQINGPSQHQQVNQQQEALRQFNSIAQAQAQNNGMNKMRQIQILQMLQARQQHNSMQNFLQLQQLGHLPQSMSMEQYMMLAGQQEQVNQHLKQLQLLQQINEGQRAQQQQNQAQVAAALQAQQPSGGNSNQTAGNHNFQSAAMNNILKQQSGESQQGVMHHGNATVVPSHTNATNNTQSQKSGPQTSGAPQDISEQLHQAYQVEKMKLKVTHQQEAVVLQMRQMQELRNAGNNSSERHMLLKKHDAEKKNLTQVQNNRQLSLQVEYQQSIRLHSNDAQQRSDAQAALEQIKNTQLKQIQQQFQQQQQMQQQQMSQIQAGSGSRQLGAQTSSPPTNPDVLAMEGNSNSQATPTMHQQMSPPISAAGQSQQHQQNPQLGWMLEQLKHQNAGITNVHQLQAYHQLKALQQQQQQNPQHHLAQVQQQLQSVLAQAQHNQNPQVQNNVNALLLQAQARAQAQAQQMQAINLNNIWNAQQQQQSRVLAQQQALQQNQHALQHLNAQMNLQEHLRQQQQRNSPQHNSDGQNQKNQTR